MSTGGGVSTFLPLAGGTETGLVNITQGLTISGPGNAPTVDGYTPLVDLLPSDADPSDVGLLVKIPGPTWGVSQRYGEGNAIVFANDGDNFVASPANILATITATSNATPVQVTVSTAACAVAADPTGVDNTHMHTGDHRAVTGTGIAALDGKWWKITVVDATHFTLNGSAAPGSAAVAGFAFTDRATPIVRMADTGMGFIGGHIAPGLRGRAGMGLPTQGLWIQVHVDCAGLLIDNAQASAWGPAPTADYILVRDARASLAARFRVNAAGQTLHDAGAVGAPGISFALDPDTGFHNPAGNTINVAAGGVNVVSFSSTALGLLDTINITTGTGTGTKIATGVGQKLGFYGVAPIAQRSGANQAAVVATGSTNVSPFGYATAGQADAIVTLVNELRAWAVAQGFIKGSA